MSDILIVDDDEVCLNFLQVYLKADGYSVAQARDGEEGYRMAKSENPKLIILDFMMPKSDGFKISKALKSDTQTQHIPIIMLTALSRYVDVLKKADVGIDDFLIKPCRPKAIRAAVSRYLCKSDQETT